uniref:Glucokinase regulatory protein n=1 Tax=Callorhinchus milii TaxID=7868 RepID=A0A4W3I2P2_CALMI
VAIFSLCSLVIDSPTTILLLQLPGYETAFPITEQSNPITKNIDTSDPFQIVQFLKECDAEIFQEEDERISNYKRLYSKSILKAMADVAKKAQELLKEPDDNLIVLSGCGTSGRLAFLLAAPFVAGQLDLCINKLDKFTPVLVGFNPVNMARSDNIEGWHSTFQQVAERIQKLHDLHKGYIINPAIGPEAIAGSSRMKGGSTTKILLETILLTAHKAVSDNSSITDRCLLDMLKSYEQVHKNIYSHSTKIATLVKHAGASLQKNSHIYYIGWKSLGIIGIIDASECVPTFGADSSHVRGFVNNGFEEMANNNGDLSSLGPEFAISHEYFLKTVLPTIQENDTVVFIFTLDASYLNNHACLSVVWQQICTKRIFLYNVSVNLQQQLEEIFSVAINVTWPKLLSEDQGSYIQRFQYELSTKWVLNAISTGAHVLKGKVYYNHMIDLRVSNSKLFGRALSLLQKFTGQSKSKCFEALLQSIYETDELNEEIKNVEISKHIQWAATMNKVVPTAVVTLIRNCSVSEAKTRLASCPIVRDAINACMTGSGLKRTAEQRETDEKEPGE